MAEIGRPRKYKTAVALRKGVDAYWASISYQVPAVISTPTGEVDDAGVIKWKSKLLTEHFDGMGKPKTVMKYLEPPSVAALCLYLGISKSTWSDYRHDEKLGPVVSYWDARYEAYLVDRLETGKHISGVIFNLEHNFGWKHRQEIGIDRETRKAVTASGMTMEEKRALLLDAARDFGEARSDREQGAKAGAEQTDRRRFGVPGGPTGPLGRGEARERRELCPTGRGEQSGLCDDEGRLAESEDLEPVAEGAERDSAGDGGEPPPPPAEPPS